MTTDVAVAAATDGPRSTRAGGGPAAGSVRAIEVVALVGLVVFGAVLRAHGFTSFDLWFDDAWAAMPARVGLSQAVHMVLTAPGYSLMLRTWVRLDPTTTWWAQLPAYVLGLLAIPAAWGLIRWFRAPRWAAFGAAVVVATSPVAIQYATRVKEYPFDLLSACVLLVLAERVRRAPDAKRLLALAAASVITFFISAGVAPIVAGAWAAVTVCVLPVRRLRGALAGALCLTAVGALAVWVAFLRRLPGVLNTNWRRRGFLLDYRSLPRIERSLSIIFGGFVHAVLAVPVPVSFFRGGTGPHDLPVALLGALVVLVAVAFPIVRSWRRRGVDPALAASLALVVAVVLAAADRVPLGDGRTDEVLYPALLVCLASACTAAATALRRRVDAKAWAAPVAAALGVALLGGSVAIGATHEAVYPSISLRGVWARLQPLVRPGDAVFVDTFNSFGWCYYQLTPCRIQVGGRPVWPQGFRPVARPSAYSVFIPAHYGIPLPEFTAAQASAARIWYVGYTLGTFDVGANPERYQQALRTNMTGLLCRDGWHPQGPIPGQVTVVPSVHAYAQLYVRDTAAQRGAATPLCP